MDVAGSATSKTAMASSPATCAAVAAATELVSSPALPDSTTFLSSQPRGAALIGSPTPIVTTSTTTKNEQQPLQVNVDTAMDSFPDIFLPTGAADVVQCSNILGEMGAFLSGNGAAGEPMEVKPDAEAAFTTLQKKDILSSAILATGLKDEEEEEEDAKKVTLTNTDVEMVSSTIHGFPESSAASAASVLSPPLAAAPSPVAEYNTNTTELSQPQSQATLLQTLIPAAAPNQQVQIQNQQHEK